MRCCAHVVGLAGLHATEGGQGVVQALRLVQMHVHAQLLARAGQDQAGVVQLRQCRAHHGAVDGGRREHALGAVAMALVRDVLHGADHAVLPAAYASSRRKAARPRAM